MNDPHDNQLDRILKDWAKHTAAGTEDLHALQQSVDQRLRTAAPPAQMNISRPIPRSRRPLVAAVLAAAAVLLVAVGFWLGDRRHNLQAIEDQSFALQRGSTELEDALSVDRQQRLLTEFRAVFGPQLAWVVERDGRADVGLSEASVAAPISRTESFVAVRLILWSRSPSDSTWKEVHVVNILTGREELVQVPPLAGETAPFEIWAYPLDDQMVAIDLHYQPNVPTAQLIDESFIQRLGESTRIVRFVKDGVEYRLDQTAHLLGNDNLG